VAEVSPALSSRAERTRSAILDAAEVLFAEKGFDATRLEDVAAAVGIRRASIVYYFRDKRELYDAVLEDVFGGFRVRLERALGKTGPLLARIEAAVSAWVDYVAARPALARIVLREVADGAEAGPLPILAQVGPFLALVDRFRDSVRDDPAYRATPIDAVHVASAIVGATVFFVAAMPSLMPKPGMEALAPPTLDAHRREVLRITRRLLGADDPDPTC
jgi:TetR/AcrR family transcriptional regulator